MPRTGLWLQVFIGLLVAVMPPILMLASALLLTGTIFSDANPDIVAILVVVGAVVWAAILAIIFARSLAGDIQSFLVLAQSGEDARDPARDAAFRRIAGALEERNRQVSLLAAQASNVAIDEEPRVVVTSIVSAARRVMRDPTWRCAVLTSSNPELLPPGVYHGVEDNREPDPIGDLERWASVSGADRVTRRIEGPWGAFAVVDVAVSDRLKAIFYAPWDGRADPTPAETDVQQLVGQHAATSLEHSVLYAQVRSQADELNRLAGVQADFLRGVTHDLQTPLTSIGALATELQAGRALPARARSDLELITHQAERLRRMVAQLLVASRLEAGALTAREEVFALAPLVERTWAALRADRPFKVTADAPAHLAVADPDRLEQVMWAVLDNAIKYSPPGSPIDVWIRPRRAGLVVGVEDQGAGMDLISRDRAFEQFYRSDLARKLAPDGSGVGLYAARGLMQLMGGSIDIDSRIGGGTTVTLWLPAEPSDPTDE